MNAADLMAIGVQKIAKVHCAELAFARAGRPLHADTTVRQCDVMQFLHLCRRIAGETDSRSVRGSRRFAIDRFGDTEGGAIMNVEQTCLPGIVLMLNGGIGAKYAEDRVVKTPGLLDIARTNHYMTQHNTLSL